MVVSIGGLIVPILRSESFEGDISHLLYLYYTINRATQSSLFCALLQKVFLVFECRTDVLVQVFHSLSRCLFSLELPFLGRLGVIPSVFEFLIKALSDYSVLELSDSSFKVVIGFQFNTNHCAPVCGFVFVIDECK